LGIVQLEEGMVTTATGKDFIGRWTYHHLGKEVIREFHADGRITITENGNLVKHAFLGSRWTIEDGILLAGIPGKSLVEEHILRDSKTLVFVNTTYGNAVKMGPE
jgi:hypothetical protein